MYDVAILYGRKFGLVDARGIKKSFDDGFAKRYIVFTAFPPMGSAKDLLKEMDYCEIKLTTNPLKDAKKCKKGLNDVYFSQLDEFGERGIDKDVC
ncbi:hypothetical protein [Mesoaciditoga lauensis]|uniref:hypothetical protein n=1 Tax=Mesoaciditoga lauensis TaxID=1495039 RepID=UPI00055DFE51|nr:hypothetical protein [Mesoaciditoga lauensis]